MSPAGDIDNVLNLFREDWHTPIYRVFTIERLIEVFEKRQLTLAKPKLWDDPFENFLMTVFHTSDNPPIYRDSLYGQCWTLQKESDAMWRIYAPNKDGVRVSSTIRKLFDSFYFNDNHDSTECFLGKVLYKSNKAIRQILNDVESLHNAAFDLFGKKQVESLLIKRDAFKHEKEIRIIYNAFTKDLITKEDIYSFKIVPLEVFTSLAFDPRMSYKLYKIIRSYFIEQGFNSKKIWRSKLYLLPKLAEDSIK